MAGTNWIWDDDTPEARQEASARVKTIIQSNVKAGRAYRTDVPKEVIFGETKTSVGGASKASKNFNVNPYFNNKAKRKATETKRIEATTKPNQLVLDWAKNLDDAKAWPEGKSLEGFESWAKNNYNVAGESASARSKAEGVPYDAGHGKARSFNAPSNLGDQIRFGEFGNQSTPGVKKAVDAVRTDIDLENTDVGFKPEKAFFEYLNSDEKNLKIIDTGKYTARQKEAILHRPDYASTAEGARMKVDKQILETAALREINKASRSSTNPNKVQAEFRAANSPKSLLTKLKSNITGRKGVRNAASIAGQSMNPFVNIAGDVVGAAMDGMVVFSTGGKDKDALADFTLSGSQAILSIGAGLVAMVPVPGARPGAYAMIKLGDNIGKVERLWNMTREGRQLANSPDVKAFKQGRTTPDIVRLNKKEGPISAADAKMHQSLWEEQNGISWRSMRGLLQ